MKYLVLFLTLCATAIGQTTHNADDLQVATIQTLHDSGSVVDGDIIALPAGTESWSTVLVISKAITLQGAGIGSTFIAANRAQSTILGFNTEAGKTYRLSGIQFIDGATTQTSTANAVVNLNGTSQAVIVDNCKFNNIGCELIMLNGSVSGVIYDCMFNRKDGRIMAKNGTATGSNGDLAWGLPAPLGQAGAMYVEDCSVINTGVGGTDQNDRITDGWLGGKVVFRMNTFYDAGIGNHGTETGQRLRSARMLEAYLNTNHIAMSGGTDAWCTIRGGTGMIWGNTITFAPSRTLNAFIRLNHYLLINSDPPWGNADGTKAWDVPDTSDGAGTPGGAGDGVFESGTCDAANTLNHGDTVGITVTMAGTTVTASSAVFTVDHIGKAISWVPGGSGSFIYDPRIITARSSDTVVTVGSSTMSGNTTSTRSTPWPFIIGNMNVLHDSSKAWSDDQWNGYQVRLKASYTGSSGGVRTVTVSPSPGWVVGQWNGWEFTKTSDNTKGKVLSNTADTITLRTDFYPVNMTGGGAFQLSLGRKIDDTTATTLTTSQTTEGGDIVYVDGMEYEIRNLLHIIDQPGAGPSDAIVGSPPNHQDLNQGLEPIYVWLNDKGGNETYQYGVSKESYMQYDVQVFAHNASFNGTTGIGVGTAAQMAAITPTTTGVGFWVTDAGDWNSTFSGTIGASSIAEGYLCEIVSAGTTDFTLIGSSSNTIGKVFKATGAGTGTGTVKPAQGTLYTWDGDSWEVHYEPYPYPHPLRTVDPPDTTAPTLVSASIDGSTLTLAFSEPVVDGAAAQFTLSSGSLSAYSGSGATRTMTVTPAAAFGDPTYTLNYTPGDIEDTAANALAAISGFVVTNDTDPPPTEPDPLFPQRKGRGPRAVRQGR